MDLVHALRRHLGGAEHGAIGLHDSLHLEAKHRGRRAAISVAETVEAGVVQGVPDAFEPPLLAGVPVLGVDVGDAEALLDGEAVDGELEELTTFDGVGVEVLGSER